MIDQIQLSNAVNKIHESLNKRYEKDADLYVSRQDEYELKKHIVNQEYAAITDMQKGKGLSPEIIFKIIIKNAAIIEQSSINQLGREVEKILEAMNVEKIEAYITSFLSDLVYVPEGMKRIILKKYMELCSKSQLQQLWEDYAVLLEESMLITLFYQRMLSFSETERRHAFIISALQTYPLLLKDESILIKIKEQLDEPQREAYLEFLFGEIVRPSFEDDIYRKALCNGYCTYGDVAFKKLCDQLYKRGTERKYHIDVLARMVARTEDSEKKEDYFIELKKFYESPVIENMIKNRMKQKIWKLYKKEEKIYKAYQKFIDSNCEQKSNGGRVSTYQQLISSYDRGERKESISYNILRNRRSDIVKLVSNMVRSEEVMYIYQFKETIGCMFWHSSKMNVKRLEELCSSMVEVLKRTNSCNTNGIEREIEKYLLTYVRKYKFKSNDIMQYMYEYHYSVYKSELA